MAGASSGLQTKRELGKATRDAFGRALEALGNNPEIVVVDGDVGNSTRTEWFAKKYPDRFFNVGIAESNLVGVVLEPGRDVLELLDAIGEEPDTYWEKRSELPWN